MPWSICPKTTEPIQYLFRKWGIFVSSRPKAKLGLPATIIEKKANLICHT